MRLTRFCGGLEDEDELDRLNAGLVTALEQSRLGFVSSTRLRGRYAIRLCVLNHASAQQDVERVLDFLESAEPAIADDALLRYERHPDVGQTHVAESGADSIDFDELRRRGTERRAEAGDELVARWDSTSDFFVILEGGVEVTIDGQRVAELGAGEFFGELAALEWGAGFSYPRLATVTATEAVHLLVFPAEDLAQLMRDIPALDREVRRRAGDRLLRH